MEPNLVGIESLRLDFNSDVEASFQVAFNDGVKSPVSTVGLDGVYRLTPGMNLDRGVHRFVDFQDLAVGLRGEWKDSQTFILEYNTIVNYYSYRLEMRFAGDRLSLVLSDPSGAPLAELAGTLESP